MLEIALANYRQRPSSYAQWWILRDKCGSSVFKAGPVEFWLSHVFTARWHFRGDGSLSIVVLVGGSEHNNTDVLFHSYIWFSFTADVFLRHDGSYPMFPTIVFCSEDITFRYLGLNLATSFILPVSPSVPSNLRKIWLIYLRPLIHYLLPFPPLPLQSLIWNGPRTYGFILALERPYSSL